MIVIREKQIPYSIIQRVIQTPFALKGISLTKRSGLQQVLYDFIMATQTSLGVLRVSHHVSRWANQEKIAMRNVKEQSPR